MTNLFRYILLLFLLTSVGTPTLCAEEVEEAEEEKTLDMMSFIFGHTGDGYCFHLTEVKGEPLCVW